MNNMRSLKHPQRNLDKKN